MLGDLLSWLWIAPALWLLVGMPMLDERRKKRSEAARKRRELEWELMMLHAERGREGLEAKLIADLRAIRAASILRAPDTTAEDMLKAVYGEVPEGVEDLPLQTKDEWVLYFWPRMRPKRRKKK